ncbi:hypothetical protein HZS_5162, partial [Henneguya salminicola]
MLEILKLTFIISTTSTSAQSSAYKHMKNKTVMPPNVFATAKKFEALLNNNNSPQLVHKMGFKNPIINPTINNRSWNSCLQHRKNKKSLFDVSFLNPSMYLINIE